MSGIRKLDALYDQLDADESLFLSTRNWELLEEVRALRRMINEGWYNHYKGLSIVVHKGKIIAADESSLQALNDGVYLAGTDNVYLVTIDFSDDDSDDDDDDSD